MTDLQIRTVFEEHIAEFRRRIDILIPDSVEQIHYEHIRTYMTQHPLTEDDVAVHARAVRMLQIIRQHVANWRRTHPDQPHQHDFTSAIIIDMIDDVFLNNEVLTATRQAFLNIPTQ